MRIEIALEIGSGVGEGPFWDADGGALWWVDITGKEVLGWRPGSEAPRRWPMPDFPAAVVLRRGPGALVALRDGLYLMDLESAGSRASAAPSPSGRPTAPTRASVMPKAASGSARCRTTCGRTARSWR